MADKVAGLLSILIAILFLGWLAVQIGSVPLWIVVLLAVAMMVADFVQTVRSGAE